MTDTASGRKSGESLIAAAFAARNIPMITYSDFVHQSASPEPSELLKGIYVVRNHPYTTFYGTQGYIEFMLYEGSKRMRAIEVKHQNTSGSVDEKLPYVILNALFHWGAQEATIVLSGAHWDDSARGKSIIENITAWAETLLQGKVRIQNISQFNNELAKNF